MEASLLRHRRLLCIVMAMLRDGYNRLIKDVRISVTDRCNFRCTYCMPSDEYEWINKKEILTFEEITRLAKIFIQLGVEKIRLTGGEPLVRRNLELLVAELSRIPGLEDLCLTTNGSLLSEKIEGLQKAGLRRINVSIDTLKAMYNADPNLLLNSFFYEVKVSGGEVESVNQVYWP